MKHIASRHNPHYRELLALAEDKRTRRQMGRTLLDGVHLMQMARQAGQVLLAVLCTPEVLAAGEVKPWLRGTGSAQAVVLPETLFRALSPSRSPTGIMAVVEIPHPAAALRETAVLLEDIQDPGNLGALLRCAAAAGMGAAYLSAGCAEAWSPKALRGGQGAQFLLDVHEQADLIEAAQGYAGHCHAAVPGGPVSLYDLDLRGPCAFAFGNEGAGLSEGLLAVCRPFGIPMPGRTESLNVAAAAAVCLFERVRQAESTKGGRGRPRV